VPFPINLSGLQGHSPIASLFESDFLYSCAADDKMSTDVGIAWSLCDIWASCFWIFIYMRFQLFLHFIELW